eukprot:s435_g2.t1
MLRSMPCNLLSARVLSEARLSVPYLEWFVRLRLNRRSPVAYPPWCRRVSYEMHKHALLANRIQRAATGTWTVRSARMLQGKAKRGLLPFRLCLQEPSTLKPKA